MIGSKYLTKEMMYSNLLVRRVGGTKYLEQYILEHFAWFWEINLWKVRNGINHAIYKQMFKKIGQMIKGWAVNVLHWKEI